MSFIKVRGGGTARYGTVIDGRKGGVGGRLMLGGVEGQQIPSFPMHVQYSTLLYVFRTQ